MHDLSLAALSTFQSRLQEMRSGKRTEATLKESVRRARSFFPCASLALSLVCSLSSCASKPPVEEVVTTDASRSSALPPGAEAVAKEPKLPARDADIEVAGDRIAEAITHLNAKRREAALRALNQSETALNRALRAHARDNNISLSLRTTLKDLDAAERAVQRGSLDATKQLATINKNLDGLDLQRAQASEPDANTEQE